MQPSCLLVRFLLIHFHQRDVLINHSSFQLGVFPNESSYCGFIVYFTLLTSKVDVQRNEETDKTFILICSFHCSTHLHTVLEDSSFSYLLCPLYTFHYMCNKIQHVEGEQVCQSVRCDWLISLENHSKR